MTCGGRASLSAEFMGLPVSTHYLRVETSQMSAVCKETKRCPAWPVDMSSTRASGETVAPGVTQTRCESCLLGAG